MTNYPAHAGLAHQAASENVAAETSAYMEHIANLLREVAVLKPRYLPFPDDEKYPDALLESCRDGILLSHLINAIQPDSVPVNKLITNIDLGQLHAPGTKNYFEVTANLNQCIEGAKKLSRVVVVNVGSDDILGKKADLVLGLVWQLVRAHLLSEVNLASHPELIRLMDPEKETLKDMLALTEEQILIRWINYHLARSDQGLRVTNFGKDLADGECYIALLRQITPDRISKESLDRAAQLPPSDREGRAQLVLEHAEQLGARQFATARDISHGNTRLNLGFVATLFNRCIGIHLPTENQIRQIVAEKEAAADRVQQLQYKVASLEDQISSLKADLERQKIEGENKQKNVEDQKRTEYETKVVALQDEHDKAAKASELHRAAVDEKLTTALASIRGELENFLSGGSVDNLSSVESLNLTDETGPISLADEPARLRKLMVEVIAEAQNRGDRLSVAEAQLEQSKKVNNLISEKIVEFAEKECITAAERKNAELSRSKGKKPNKGAR